MATQPSTVSDEGITLWSREIQRPIRKGVVRDGRPQASSCAFVNEIRLGIIPPLTGDAPSPTASAHKGVI
jgi:hypothetical protein